MQIALGVAATLFLVGAFPVFRLFQWDRRLRALMSRDHRSSDLDTHVIFLADHRDWSSTEESDTFQVTPQLAVRLDAAAQLYRTRTEKGIKTVFVLTTGRLKQAGIRHSFSVASYNRDELARRGVSHRDITLHLGYDGNGAIDSIEEAALLCEYMKDAGYTDLTVVSDVLHVSQFFWLCAWRGIYANLCPVPLMETDPDAFTVRVLSMLVTVLDPNGRNPFFALARRRRRQPIAA